MANLINSIKTMFVRSSAKCRLDKWKKKTSVEGFRHFVVERRCEENKLFVDLYWSVKQEENPENKDFIYQRVAWEKLCDMINDVERHQLISLVKHLEDKRKRAKEKASIHK